MPTDTPTRTRKRQLAKKKPPRYKVSTGDTKSSSDLNRAKKFKKTKTYKQAVRKVYSEVPVERRKKILAAPASPERRQARKVHKQRTTRRRELEQSAAKHDVVTDADLKIAAKFNKPKKHEQKRGISNLNFASATIPSAAIIAHKKEVAKATGNITENAMREAIGIPANIVPATVHIAKPVYKDPLKPKAYVESGKRAGEAAIALPKEYVKAAKKKGLEGVGETFVKHPLSTALTVAPLPRAPGLVAGGVARRAGKMPKIADKTLPGTKMKEAPVRSKSYFKAKRQANKPVGQVENKHVETRVDEQVALMEDLSRRVHATTYRKTYKSRKKEIGRKKAVNEAGIAAKEAQEKIRSQQKFAIAEGMGLTTKPKVKPNPEYTHGKNLRDSAANSARLERADGRESSARDLERQVKQLDSALEKTPKFLEPKNLPRGEFGPRLAPSLTGGEVKTFKNYQEAVNAAQAHNSKLTGKKSVEMIPYEAEGKLVVIPKSAVKRLEQHEARHETGPLGAAAKGYNTLWRKNVLALHPSWYAGNIIEAALRSGVAGVGPKSYLRGYKSLAELKRKDPDAYIEMTGHATKGGHLAMQVRLPHEFKSDITGHNFLSEGARKVQALRDNPKGPKQVADAWNHLTDFTMGTLSGKAESFFQTGMLGKELSRSPLMDGHVNKTSKAALADAAKGMRETHNQVALGRAVDRMYGKYGKFDPGTRNMIANYTPFISWTMNSLNWLYHVLPADHPVLTAAVASSQPYVDEWLKDKGLNKFVKGHLPRFLQGAIPTKTGYARFPTRYTPFAFSAGFPESFVGALLPQLEPAYNLAAHEINWKGQKVKNPDGTPLDDWQLVVAGILTLLEGSIPGAQQVAGPSDRYASEGARTPKTLLKPKPGKEIANAFLNPFVQVNTPESKKKKVKSLLDKPTPTKQKSLLDTPKKKQKSLLDSP